MERGSGSSRKGEWQKKVGGKGGAAVERGSGKRK